MNEIEQLKERIAEREIQVRGWITDTEHPDKERILSDILQELKFYECKLALSDPEFMDKYVLNIDQCKQYIDNFDNMKKEKVSNMADLETILDDFRKKELITDK